MVKKHMSQELIDWYYKQGNNPLDIERVGITECPKCGESINRQHGFQNLRLLCSVCGHQGDIFRPSQSPRF